MSNDRYSRLEHIQNADDILLSKVAAACYAAGTSDDHDIASSRSFVYRALEEALVDTLFHVFRLTTSEARHARDLLSEYGLDDSLTGTSM